MQRFEVSEALAPLEMNPETNCPKKRNKEQPKKISIAQP
jgi:hypothetical protein